MNDLSNKEFLRELTAALSQLGFKKIKNGFVRPFGDVFGVVSHNSKMWPKSGLEVSVLVGVKSPAVRSKAEALSLFSPVQLDQIQTALIQLGYLTPTKKAKHWEIGSPDALESIIHDISKDLIDYGFSLFETCSSLPRCVEFMKQSAQMFTNEEFFLPLAALASLDGTQAVELAKEYSDRLGSGPSGMKYRIFVSKLVALAANN